MNAGRGGTLFYCGTYTERENKNRKERGTILLGFAMRGRTCVSPKSNGILVRCPKLLSVGSLSTGPRLDDK